MEGKTPIKLGSRVGQVFWYLRLKSHHQFESTVNYLYPFKMPFRYDEILQHLKGEALGSRRDEAAGPLKVMSSFILTDPFKGHHGTVQLYHLQSWQGYTHPASDRVQRLVEGTLREAGNDFQNCQHVA